MVIITEHRKFERKCVERLETVYDDHDCHKYISLEGTIEYGEYNDRKKIDKSNNGI